MQSYVCACVCVVGSGRCRGGEVSCVLTIAKGPCEKHRGALINPVCLSLPTRVDSSLSERIPEINGTNWRVRAVVARKAAQWDPCLIWSVLGSE